tara:strand:+ start:119 stop:301 length:183 start_codon:yes stop_codon:yes gene_type:complete
MTRQEFYRAHKADAFKTAWDIVERRRAEGRSEGGTFTEELAREEDFILYERYHDYKYDRV